MSPPESVVFTYDGATTATATITGATPGRDYAFICGDPGSSGATITAVSTSFVLTVSDIAVANPSDTFYAEAQSDVPFYHIIGATVFEDGSSSEYVFDAVWDYDGIDTVTVTFDSVLGVLYDMFISDFTGPSGSSSGVGTGGQLQLIAVGVNPQTDDYFWALLETSDDSLLIADRLFTAGLSGSGFPGNPASEPIAPPTQVFGGSRFYEAPPWRFIVGDLEDNTLTFLDNLAMDRSVTVTRAASRVISARVPSDNPEVNIPAPSPDDEPFVSEGTRIVSCFRREAPSGSAEKPWVIRARGLVMSLTDDADSDHATSTFVAYDPWKYLYSRPVINPDTDSPLDDTSYPAGYRANDIITEQFFLAGIDGGTIFTDYGQTDFFTGTIEDTEPFPNEGDGTAITFRSGTTLGEMLDILVATGTCDVVFDPIYDIENRPGLLCQLSIYQTAGSFRPNAVMGWDRWPRSLVALSRQVEGTERANIMQMYAGQGGPSAPQEQDVASLAKFGEYWALQYLPGVPTLAGAHLLAQRQLALLKDGQYTYSLSPASERAPLLFEEYREADTVPVYASDRFRDPISGLPVRVESIPIVIGDDELERVNSMLVSFAPESGS